MTDLVSRTFRKDEKLCSQKLMGDLFLSGKSFLSYPLRIVWKTYTDLPVESLAQAGFSVPKRTFKHAVDRNLLKRRIRESYRLHKSKLYDSLNDCNFRVALMLIYIAKEELPFEKIESAVIKAINKINGEFQPTTKDTDSG